MRDAIAFVGERTCLACSFRRHAENIVPQTGMDFTVVRARRPNLHAGRVRSPRGLQ